jgi:hypothetical protein
MSVKLNRPPKPEESQKNSNFNGKTIPYLGFEPGTSGLAVITTAPLGRSIIAILEFSKYCDEVKLPVITNKIQLLLPEWKCKSAK